MYTARYCGFSMCLNVHRSLRQPTARKKRRNEPAAARNDGAAAATPRAPLTSFSLISSFSDCKLQTGW